MYEFSYLKRISAAHSYGTSERQIPDLHVLFAPYLREFTLIIFIIAVWYELLWQYKQKQAGDFNTSACFVKKERYSRNAIFSK